MFVVGLRKVRAQGEECKRPAHWRVCCSPWEEFYILYTGMLELNDCLMIYQNVGLCMRGVWGGGEEKSFRNILSGTKHTQHLVCAAERRRSPGYHAYNFSYAIFVNLAYSGFEYGVGYHSCEGNHRQIVAGHCADLV